MRHLAVLGMVAALVGAIKTGVLMDPDQPRFMRAVDWTGKSGLDNPDNDYHIALIRDDADYRITGTRGSTRSLVFQLVIDVPVGFYERDILLIRVVVGVQVGLDVDVGAGGDFGV